MDLFTPEFKRLKARRPLPDFSEVIDINYHEKQQKSHEIFKIHLEETEVKPVLGFKPCEDWDVFRFPDYPGFIVIRNPFLDGYQRYWVSRCLQDFSSDQRNSSNLTNLGQFEHYDVWEDFVSRQCSTFTKDDRLKKLRWVTLGYHYGWNTKEYSEDRKAEFPRDVQCLSQFFSHCLGFGPFRAEAGIVNYYHLESTLGGHTDHSEIDHTAPLLSFSFGQSCVFLLGGPTKETKPMAIFLHSGDVCVMSKEARLAYHAVPKILTPKDNNWIPPCFSVSSNRLSGKKQQPCDKLYVENSHVNDNGSQLEQHQGVTNSNCDNSLTKYNKKSFISDEYESYIDILNKDIEQVIGDLTWKPFEVFLSSSRINMNLRQVLPPGSDTVEPNMMKFV